MSSRSRIILPFISLSLLALLLGCGSGTHRPVAPPSGGFSNTNLNGTYTFSALGANGNGVFAMAGTLDACGCTAGTISGGSVEIVDPLGPTGASPINSNSTYLVTQDGRGKATLSISTATRGTVQIVLDFVLTSSSHGLMTRYDGNGTGSGTIDLQSSVSQNSLAGPYAFSVSGSDLNNNPLAAVGAFTLDSAGNIVANPSGVVDFNYANVPSIQLGLGGFVVVGAAGAPGTTALDSTFANFTFDVYPVDNNHLKIIENDGQAILVGDVFFQPSSAIPNGNLVFTMAGLDTSGIPFTAGGLMSSDGVSTISNGLEDINDGGVVDGGTTTPQNFSGTFTDTGNGRLEAALTGFGGGTLFAAYPSVGGLLMLEIDSGLGAGITGGVALEQTSTTLAPPPQGYGFNMTGADGNGNLDLIAQFNSTSTTFQGLLDENEGGFPGSPANFHGSYSVGTGGLGSASFNTGLSSMFFYIVDSSTVLFISTDPNQVGVGAFQLQSTPVAQAAVVARHLAMLRSVPRAHSANKRTQKRIGH